MPRSSKSVKTRVFENAMTATVFSISRSSDFILEGKVFDLALLQREPAEVHLTHRLTKG